MSSWWPVLGLFGLQLLIALLTRLGYFVARAALDRAVPDDLPIDAGTWAAQQAARTGLAVDVVAGGGEGSYDPLRRIVVLSPETFQKRDPSFWAIAAHELGHAQLHRRAPGCYWLLAAVRVGGAALGSLSTAFLIGTLVCGVALAPIARALLVVAVVADAVVLLEELDASRRARRMLATAAAGAAPSATILTGGAVALVPASRLSLLSALATYAAALVVRAVPLVGWSLVLEAARRRQVTAASPGGLAALAAAILALLLVVSVVVAIVAFLRGRGARVGHFDLVVSVAACAFLALVWRQRVDLDYQVACVLAGFSAMGVIIGVLLIILVLVRLALSLVARVLLGPLLPRLVERLRGLTRGERLLVDRRARLPWAPRPEPTLLDRLPILVRAAAVAPLLAAWIGMVLRS
jgi:Zn-dependent membrane protease YugP